MNGIFYYLNGMVMANVTRSHDITSNYGNVHNKPLSLCEFVLHFLKAGRAPL